MSYSVSAVDVKSTMYPVSTPTECLYCRRVGPELYVLHAFETNRGWRFRHSNVVALFIDESLVRLLTPHGRFDRVVILLCALPGVSNFFTLNTRSKLYPKYPTFGYGDIILNYTQNWMR